MSWKDFLFYFRLLTIAEINDNASYMFASQNDEEGKGVYFQVEIKRKGNYSFQVDQTPNRIYGKRGKYREVVF